MDSLYVPILIAAAVALLVWGIAVMVSGLIKGEKRKLQQRLRDENTQRTGGGGSQLPLSITRQTEATGASATLAMWSPMQSLHRYIIQASPDTTLSRFVITCL